MPRGRPTALTPDVQDKIIEAIRGGNYQETAAQYAGVHVSSFYAWMVRGQNYRAALEAGEEPDEKEAIFADFSEAVEEAKAQARVRNVALIQRAAQDSWQAAAWWLERTRPQEFGRFTRTELTGPAGGPVQIQESTPSELEDKVRRIMEQRGLIEPSDADE